MLTIECDELLELNDDSEIVFVVIPAESLTLGDDDSD